MIEQNITLIRGDTGRFKISLEDENKNLIVLGEGDQIYFTIKDNYEVQDFVLQKKIGNGITLGDDNCYHLLLNSSDTDNLEFKKYVYDIQVVIGTDVQEKTTVKRGKFITDYEVTYAGNEV